MPTEAMRGVWLQLSGPGSLPGQAAPHNVGPRLPHHLLAQRWLAQNTSWISCLWLLEADHRMGQDWSLISTTTTSV